MFARRAARGSFSRGATSAGWLALQGGHVDPSSRRPRRASAFLLSTRCRNASILSVSIASLQLPTFSPQDSHTFPNTDRISLLSVMMLYILHTNFSKLQISPWRMPTFAESQPAWRRGNASHLYGSGLLSINAMRRSCVRFTQLAICFDFLVDKDGGKERWLHHVLLVG